MAFMEHRACLENIPRKDELRSAVQVGNPLEKILIESCLEAIKLEEVVGLQDCEQQG